MNLSRKIMGAAAALLLAIGANGQQMETVFTSMPDTYIPQLENAWRKDLVDLYKSGKEAKLKNMMNGTSTLLKLTDNYLLLQPSSRSQVEMKLLPLINNTFVVCMVTTVEGPVADSRIAFYTTDWQPLENSDLIAFATGEWYLKKEADAGQLEEARSLLDMDLIRYDLNPDSLTLKATYTTPEYLDKESREKVAPCLAGPLVYEWRRSHFEATIQK